MSMPQWLLKVEKRSLKQLNESISKSQIDEMKHTVTRNKTIAFSCTVGRLTDPSKVDDQYIYSVDFLVRSTKFLKEGNTEVFKKVYARLCKKAASLGWEVIPSNEVLEVVKDVVSTTNTVGPRDLKPPFQVYPLNSSVMEEYFNDIYERDAHIRIIHDSITRFVRTDKKSRSHTILYGPPACCKTGIVQAFKRWYENVNESGPEMERVAILDATTLTKAGFEKWVLQRAQEGNLPEIICIEEIEKHTPDNLLSLLSVMDARACISRTNARIGRMAADTPMVIWATCNDRGTLEAFHKGALWSRFVHQLPCVRPSYELMRKILVREVNAMADGKVEWVDLVLDFAKKLSLNDPRKIIGLLDGGDRLIDNSYQDDIMAIVKAEKEQKTMVEAI